MLTQRKCNGYSYTHSSQIRHTDAASRCWSLVWLLIIYKTYTHMACLHFACTSIPFHKHECVTSHRFFSGDRRKLSDTTKSTAISRSVFMKLLVPAALVPPAFIQIYVKPRQKHIHARICCSNCTFTLRHSCVVYSRIPKCVLSDFCIPHIPQGYF